MIYHTCCCCFYCCGLGGTAGWAAGWAGSGLFAWFCCFGLCCNCFAVGSMVGCLSVALLCCLLLVFAVDVLIMLQPLMLLLLFLLLLGFVAQVLLLLGYVPSLGMCLFWALLLLGCWCFAAADVCADAAPSVLVCAAAISAVLLGELL